MWKWIAEYPLVVIISLIVIAYVIIVIYNDRKGLLARAALYAVSRAEEAWGSQTGRIKFAEAYTYLTKQYPIITFFFTEAQLTEIIETALVEMKKIITTKQGLESKKATSNDT